MTDKVMQIGDKTVPTPAAALLDVTDRLFIRVLTDLDASLCKYVIQLRQ